MAERYITAVELEERVGGPDVLLSALPALGVAPTSQRVDLARDGVEQRVTAALGAKYGDQLPTTPAATGELLKSLVAELVLYALLEQLPDGPDEAARARHQIAVARLGSLVAGDLVLPVPPTATTDPNPVVDMGTDGILGRDNLAGWLE